MGYILSGRRDGNPLVENCLVLDIAWLMRLAPIREGQSGSGEIKWSLDGDAIGTLRFRLDLRDAEHARLIVHWQWDAARRSIPQVVALMALPQHLGGRRWWMRCPVTGERVRTLHLPPGSNSFASRKAWGLAYRVERLNRFDRPFEKLFRAQRRLGNVQGLGAGIEKPKGMWQRTFARHVTTLEQHDRACAEKIAALIGNA